MDSGTSVDQSTAIATVIVAGAFAAVCWIANNCRPQGKDGPQDKDASPPTVPVFSQYPRQYIARRGTPEVIDGDLSKAVWQLAPWSEEFKEIRGDHDAPPGTGPTEAQSTRMKMLWDDDFLYIAAIMEVAAGDEFVAKFTERNSPIFHTDSDFEVFVDPAGCCHGYKELEMNAINTVWNLMLNRPYSDGGGERSGRVAAEGEADYWEVRKQKTAARILSGALEDPSQPARWCCEIALAHSDTLPGAPVCGPTPKVGATWRINFSRVEKKGSVNWVWSPQIVWTPGASPVARYQGQVNMHLPDAWGYLVFGDDRGRLNQASKPAWRDPAWPARHAAMSVYYSVHSYRQKHKGQLPSRVEELQNLGFLRDVALSGCKVSISASDEAGKGGFLVEAVGNGWVASVRNDRLLKVTREGS